MWDVRIWTATEGWGVDPWESEGVWDGVQQSAGAYTQGVRDVGCAHLDVHCTGIDMGVIVVAVMAQMAAVMAVAGATKVGRELGARRRRRVRGEGGSHLQLTRHLRSRAAVR